LHRAAKQQRIARHSSGWIQMRKYLETRQSQRVLDVGPTSSGNINYLTGLGHSVYMSNLVEEAAQPGWSITREGETEPEFDVDRFIAEQMNFSNRKFDIVLFWDTADYLPPALTARVFNRIHKVMEPEGVLLAYFHGRSTGPDTAFHCYHLTAGDTVEMQPCEQHPIQQTFQNRAIENLFGAFSGFRFFLAKDNNREVLVFR
jgi:SAM-dependent methyltransferase